MTHHASPAFWACYSSLPTEIRSLSDQAFERLKQDSRHPGLRFKKVGGIWSARVGAHYRALAMEVPDGLLWFWIGLHADYDRLVG